MVKTHRTDMITIIVVGLLAFGLQILQLGFFQDDWNFVFYSSARGAQGLLEFLLVDGRPGATWVYILGFAMLGYKPALWQFFTIALRILTTINFWMILRSLWPARRYGNLIASIFFLVYPFFTLQPLSVAYAPHFMAYFLYSLSILLMIRALEKPEKYLLYSIPSVLCMFLHLFTVEYFVGLEILRPLVIWFFISAREKTSLAKTLRRVLMIWLPYLLTLVFFVGWRSFLSTSTGVRNNPLDVLLDSGKILSAAARNLLADVVLMLVSAWSRLIDPELFVIGPSRNFNLFMMTVAGALGFYFLARPANHEEDSRGDLKGVFLAGALIIAAGLISTYAGGFIIHLKIAPWNSRFSLSSLLGLAMISSALVETVITSKNIRHISFAVLVGLLIGWHNQNTLNFKDAWVNQARFYEQLVWRAPSLKPNTALVTNDEILTYMGDYPTSFAINSLYGAKQINGTPYWYFALSENFHFQAGPIIHGGPLEGEKAPAIFRGNGQDAIFITYDPGDKQCLWVLRPPDGELKSLPAEMKKGAQVSNYGNIHPEQEEHGLYNQIVKENRNTWCYFYEKADLARQANDWKTVLALWTEAQSKGYRPDHGFEFIPFIEAYARQEQWENAFQLTRDADKTTEAMYFVLCPAWQRLAQETAPSSQKDVYVNKAYEMLRCVP